MNHLPAQLKLYMMWGMPIMLCLINEALYCLPRNHTTTTTDNIMQMFPVSVKWELRDRCERQVCMDWLIFRLKCSGKRWCSQSGEGVMWRYFMKITVWLMVQLEVDSEWHSNAAPKKSSRNLLERAASPPRNQRKCPEWKLASTVSYSIKSRFLLLKRNYY